MIEPMSNARASAVDAVTDLTEYLMCLLAYTDLLEAQGFLLPAREARRALMRAVTALHVLRDELTTIEIVERLVAPHRAAPS
jgi:hypothetical protein